ncbi:sigma-70 family RNA polymerase sigma factor [Paenibacillus sp. IB182496]|uniref:Sigma-70 family RNA polymerase sigma factor n=1 Tax=Paenibacillus sabuli TaxID=2772509 RepID=A0A927BTX6_9BACL|nr:sigma-70 family RNA polymerase sigma factor [Paenibacillus sabuli]MBD2845454.1 sigma-70 family RNA polymerase sigma factor [Paenibacillus sabuli]
MLDMSTVESYRPLLMTLAYRMLGSLSEAEDIVQDALVDYTMTVDRSSIRHEKAYLVRMVTNRSLKLKQSARKRHEFYVGQWLPEPAIADDEFGRAASPLGSATAESGNPANYIERQENITYMMLVMLERLNAVERAVFLLRETLDFDYGEIADIVQKSEANCRKIFSRAKEKLLGSTGEDGGAEAIDPMRLNEEQAWAFAKAFMQAAETGNSSALVDMLAHDAVFVIDGGGKARAAINPIEGSERIAAFFISNVRKGTLGDSLLPVDVSGQPGFIVSQNGQPTMVMVFGWDSEKKISRIFIILNPDKLKNVTKQFS